MRQDQGRQRRRRDPPAGQGGAQEVPREGWERGALEEMALAEARGGARGLIHLQTHPCAPAGTDLILRWRTWLLLKVRLAWGEKSTPWEGGDGCCLQGLLVRCHTELTDRIRRGKRVCAWRRSQSRPGGWVPLPRPKPVLSQSMSRRRMKSLPIFRGPHGVSGSLAPPIGTTEKS